MGREMRWWGWGEDDHAGSVSDAALTWLEGELGALDAPRGAVALEDVRLQDPRLPSAVRERCWLGNHPATAVVTGGSRKRAVRCPARVGSRVPGSERRITQ